ncbi:MAG TPA: glycosyltransferase family 2 protein [Fimbriimonadaceae bacterium]|nr:glycosyltransferase family 2 protein [Fimbriimonadaceae bacterium]
MRLTACIPCYNSASTIEAAIDAIRAQSVPIQELFVADDGSTDETAERARARGVRVVEMGSNQGRGAVRARCVEETKTEFLLSVDGTGAIAPDFVETATPWFEDPEVGVTFGRITQEPGRTTAERWRGRHLYKVDEVQTGGLKDGLITWAFMARVEALRQVGNFDRSLRHSEDLDMGRRLIGAGWKIAYEPAALVVTQSSNTMSQVLERFWRWHGGLHPRFSARDYFRAIAYSFKVHAKRDLAARDPASALISLWLPHYCAYRSLTYRS